MKNGGIYFLGNLRSTFCLFLRLFVPNVRPSFLSNYCLHMHRIVLLSLFRHVIRQFSFTPCINSFLSHSLLSHAICWGVFYKSDVNFLLNVDVNYAIFYIKTRAGVSLVSINSQISCLIRYENDFLYFICQRKIVVVKNKVLI